MTYAELAAHHARRVDEAERWGWAGSAADAIHSLGNHLASAHAAGVRPENPVPAWVLERYEA